VKQRKDSAAIFIRARKTKILPDPELAQFAVLSIFALNNLPAEEVEKSSGSNN